MHNVLIKIVELWRHLIRSYSQDGEDRILKNYFSTKKNGYYIDVGAHHPFRFSNTYFFYKKGWSGINIDATPGSMILFNKYRPRDINIEAPISNDNKKINYFIFDEPALNSFSSRLSRDRATHTKYRIEKTIKLKPMKLSEVLDKYLVAKMKIDFMSVDVEGFEFEVLTSNNWNKYNPRYILVEMLDTKLENVSKNKVYLYLVGKKYRMVEKIGRNVLFKKQK